MRTGFKVTKAILAIATALAAVEVLAATWTNPRSYLGETWCYSEDASGVCVFDVYGGRYESGAGTLSFDMTQYDFSGTINSVEGFWNERWDSVDFRQLTTVRCFGPKAFYACPNLWSVLGISAGVTNVGAYAFANCGNLSMCNVVQEITKGSKKGITKGLKSIGTGAFSNCGFGWVTIPSTVDRIGELAFSGCRGLRYAYVPTTCEIAANAFSGCRKDFQLITYKANSVARFVDRGQIIATRTINYGECYGELPKPVRDDWVFVGWEIDGNLIEDQSICRQLGDHVFTAVWKQTAIMAFDANGGVGSVTNEQDCAKTLAVPKVTREGYSLVGWFPVLPALVPETNMTFIAQWRINNYEVVFDSNGGSGGATNIQAYASDIISPHVERWGCVFDGWIPEVDPTVPASNVTYTARWKVCEVILDSVEQSMSALYPKDYQKVQTVYLPAGIARIPSFFFAGCSSLTKVSIPDSVTEIDYYAFDGCDALIDTVTIPGVKIVDCWVVGYTAALTENLKLNGVRGIASYAFNRCTGLKDITIGDGVKGIGWLAFDDCFGLTNVTISAGVTNIADGAFSGCTNVTSLTASAIHGYMPREKLITVNIPDGVTHIGGFAGCTGLKNVAIPDSVTDIGDAAFRDCSALKEIVMPKGLKRIGDYAFERCVSIKSIEVPDGAETIGECVFAGCTNLQTVTIPSSVKSKPYGWFNGCDSLRSVVIPGHIGMTGYGKFVEEITISRGSTNICDCAFEGCINITNISIPDEVVSIGRRAFGGCDKLESIYMPNGVKSIEDSAFSGCTSLSNATIPGSVTNIGVSLFWGCPGIIDAKVPQCVLDRGLQNVFPDSYATITNISYSSVISRIPERAFDGCAKLKSVVVPEGVQCIGKYAFEGCEDLEEVLLPESVVIIEECAFSGCRSLKNVTIPKNVESIGWGAFAGCDGLTSVTIPNSVTNIGDRVFFGCSGLISIIIPDSVTSIGDDAFYGCDGLTEVSLPANFTGVSFENCTNVVRLSAPYLPRGVGSEKLSSVVIPEGVTNIVDSAFYGCGSLTNVIISDSVKRIGNSAFGGCSSLADVNIPGSVEEIGGHAFAGCSSLTNVIIGAGVANISDRAFADCASLKTIFVPDNVESIGTGAFSGCSSLTNIVIPFVGSCRGSKSRFGHDGEDLFGWIFGWSSYDGGNEVEQFYDVGQSRTYWIPASLRCVEITDEKQIGTGAFHNCRGLKSVIIPEGTTSLGAWAFGDCSGLRTMIVPNSVRTNDGAFGGCMFDKIIMPGHLKIGDVSKDIEISEGSTFIAAGAFHGYSRLRSVTIPNTVTNIGYGAFYDCKWITDIVMPKGVRTIDGQAFYDCIGLKSLSIMNPDVQFTGGATFGGCTNLSDVTLPGWDCGIPLAFGSVTNVVITPGTISIAEGAFRDCSTIKGVAIPDSVIGVGDYAFVGCSAIERLTIPQCICSESLQKVFPDAYDHICDVDILEGVRSIGQNAFAGCEALSRISIPSSIVLASDYAFSGCTDIERVDIVDFPAWLKIRFGVEANPLAVSTAVLYLNGKPLAIDGTFAVPNDVVTIPDYAFRNQTGLKNVIFPDGLTRIGVGAFDGCTALRSINLPASLTDWGLDSLPPAMREGYAYDANGLMIVDGWLLDCQDKTLSTLMVPEGVVGIGSYALAEMYDLETVNLPQSLRCIATSAFEDCSWIQNLQFMSGLRYVGPEAFRGCSSLLGASFADGVEHIGANAFKDCWQMTSVRLPYTVAYIGDGAFAGCSAIRGVTVPTHLKTMQELFPASYAQIETAEVAEGETTVMDDMFKGCVALRGGATQTDMSMILNTVTNIGARAFQGCTSLTAFVVPDSVVKIGASVFQGCTALWNVTLSRSLTEIPDYAFYGCSMLETMVVPENVNYLGNRFFSGRTNPIQGQEIENALYYLCANAPDYHSGAYAAIAGNMTTYVLRNSRSWDGRQGSRVLPQSWNGYDITYWTPNRFDVTFDANGGRFDSMGGSTWSEQQITDMTYALPSTEPVRPGWAFEGWWTEQTGGAEVRYTTVVTATRTHTIYAHWRSLGNKMTVTFNSNGGTVVTPGTQDYVPGQTFGQFPAPTRRGYTFQGWWTEAVNGIRMTEATQVPAADMELFAHWKPITYYVRFHANGGTGTMSDQPFTFDVSGALKTHAFTRTGFAFTGWATTPSGQVRYAENKTVVNLEEVDGHIVDLYAVWSGVGYSVRFDSNGGTGIMDNQTIAVGETQNLWPCAFARGGYTFAGWAVSPTDAEAKKVTYRDGQAVKNLATSNGATVPLYAVWVTGSQTVRITFDANGGSVAPNDYWDCVVGTAVEAFPTPTRPGFTFAGWWTARTGGTQVSSIARVTSAQTFYAHWTENGSVVPGDNSVTVTFNGNGGSVTETQRTVASGAAVGELPEPVRTGYAFMGWFTAASGGVQATDATIVDADVTFYAHWTAIGWTTRSAGTGKVAIKACANPAGDIEIPSVLNGKTVVAIDNYVFFGATGLTGVVIPASVESIGVKAFKGCSNLKKVTLPARLATLGQAAFQDCVSLTEVDVPALGDNYLWSSTFEGCTSLRRVSLPEGITAIGTSSFANCKALVEVNIPSTVKTIKSFAFFSCESLADVTLPTALVKIEQKAFKNCVSMTAVEIPSGVKTLGKAVFFNSGLVEATVPGGIAKVDDYCFQKCAALRKVTLSEGVKETGASVWANDGALEEVVFPKTLETLGGYAFFRCPSLATLWNFSSLSNLSSIGEKAFKHCTSLKSLAMPSQVTSLPKEMCNYCSSLETVTGTWNVTSIGQSAFSNCPKLKSVAGLDAAALETVKRGREWRR